MIKKYRINQKVTKNGKFSAFDIEISEEGMREFISHLDGIIKVYELIITEAGQTIDSIPNKSIKKIIVKYDYKLGITNQLIQAYNNNIYFKENTTKENIDVILFEHCKEGLTNTKPVQISTSINYISD